VRRLRHPAHYAPLILIVVLWLASNWSGCPQHGVPGERELGSLELSSLRPGRRLVVALLRPGMTPELAGVRLRVAGRSFPLRDVADLRGNVAVRSAAQALELARMRTAPSTYDLWETQDLFVEVTRVSRIASISLYGATQSQWSPQESSGYLGVLSEEPFRAGGFVDPVVTPFRSGFKIIRWVYVYNNGVRKIHEQVSTEGDYFRRTLEERPAPVLPGTEWQIPPKL
jgi:hypothetical protein